ncbi:hypothetical protein PSDVSF_24330 [Pseudodesulfovibrio sediminis]|uniref:Aminoglycoside phosphotransferase domain-containing protein n=2 Tax=Pseudodesulfovibrio sediminis TaxID=2810563 RepID=A0ABN6ES45_9BACT|nr:hypothetical protein PSDVSF_24330 [Pseudodesulfovibrio sediminis]
MITVKAPLTRPPLFVPAPDIHRLLAGTDLEEFLPIVAEADKAQNHVPTALVHNDLHQDNFIFPVNGKVLLIDFESFSHNPIIADAMFAAFRLSAGIPEGFDTFMEAYAAIRPLDESEKELGLLLLAGDFIRKLAFILKEKEAGNDAFVADYEKYREFARTTVSWLK